MPATPHRIRWHVALGLLCVSAGSYTHAQIGPNGEMANLTAKFVDVNGVKTRYYDYGRGEAIVLIHGGEPGSGSSANWWSRNIHGLAARFRVLAVDRLAQGMTDNPKEDKDFSRHADAEHVSQFIRTMKLDRVHLIGHSSGGAVAVAVAVEHPEIVKTLTDVDSGFRIQDAEPGTRKIDPVLAKCPGEPGSDEFQTCRIRALAYSPDSVSADFLEGMRRMRSLPKSLEARKRAAARLAQPQGAADDRVFRQAIDKKVHNGALQMPVLIYGGKQDPLHWRAADPHSLWRELEFYDIVGATNPRVKMIIVNHAGHMPQLEQPEQFNRDLINFIEFWNDDLKRQARLLDMEARVSDSFRSGRSDGNSTHGVRRSGGHCLVCE
jgi:2-hydroxy-6-oxonona-2,4-dienedioate hydrolase